MEPSLYSVNKITPDMRNWSVKVCIVNKTCPRTSSQATPIIFQKLLLSDEQGNKVEAMLYRTDVDLWKYCLEPNETYLISNAVVRPVNPAFKNPLVDNNYQWIISAKTTILPTQDKVLVPSALTPVFTCYDHFQKLIGTTALISTIAVIIDKHKPRFVLSKGRENTLREYVAIDEAFKPFVITFWNDTNTSSSFKPFVITFWNDVIPEDIYNLLDSIEYQHVIAALNFRVTNYHGVSLSSTSSSLVLPQFKDKRFEDLQKWQIPNTEEITGPLNENKPLEIHQPNFNTGTQKSMSVQDILTTTQPGRFTSIVKGKLLRPDQKFLYLCCDRCHCLESAEYGSFFKCRSCHINKTATPRYRFSLLVFDETGEIDVTVFGKEGDKLLNISADDFWRKNPDIQLLDLPSVLASFKSRLEQMLLKIEIQSKNFNRHDGASILSYTVHSLECQSLTPLPAPTDKSPVPPSSSGTNYLTPNDINNSIEDPASSPQTPADMLNNTKVTQIKKEKSRIQL